MAFTSPSTGGWASWQSRRDSRATASKNFATEIRNGRIESTAFRFTKADCGSKADMTDAKRASAGHKLGQLVGDWFEEFLALPLLQRVADHLNLYLDHRFRTRKSRNGEKIIWTDVEGNGVDYDFVMELDGTDKKSGIPVAFLECFWRRGARHSKDKARDDTGKLLPMRDVHPTARFLGIVAGGDFTAPGRALVQNRQIDLFYIPKAKIVAAFQGHGQQIDYPDRLS